MSSVQKPEYFMGLQRGEEQSPQAVFVNVLWTPRGLELCHVLGALCTHRRLPTADPFLAMSPPKPLSLVHILFLTVVVVCSGWRLYFDMVTFFLAVCWVSLSRCPRTGDAFASHLSIIGRATELEKAGGLGARVG